MKSFTIEPKNYKGKESICMLFFITVLFVFCIKGLRSQSWTPKQAPLMTRWSNKVNPDSVLPEYPRPLMVRNEWLNLNGIWQFDFAQDGDSIPIGKNLPKRILVPFPVESALSGIMEPAERVWYRKLFNIPEGWQGKNVLLHFDAVDWEAKVYLNGNFLGIHRGGYDRFTFDITDFLKPGEQELILYVFDPTDSGEQPYGKQHKNPQTIWFTASTGIWQPVWLEPVPENYIENFQITPDIDSEKLKVKVNVNNPFFGGVIRLKAYDKGILIGEASGYPDTELQLQIPSPHLWSPDDPYLYDLQILLINDAGVIDSVQSYFAMRKVSIGLDENGITRILLNNEFVFQIGLLDQGYWPDGVYTAPTDEALKYDVEIAKKFGFNMVRKHVKVERERWYYWCDKLGLLVWQDMPNGRNITNTAKLEFEKELNRIVHQLINFPSIIMWVIFNEGWGQYDTSRLVNLVKSWDPYRLVDNASGWVDNQVGDVIDWHRYPGPASPIPEPKRAAVLGEFGGGWREIEGHTWDEFNGAGFQSGNELANFYLDLSTQINFLKEKPGLSAAVYTELYDVEKEYAGLMTYDREMLKTYYFTIWNANRNLTVTSIDNNNNNTGPFKFELYQNYPNPFNTSTNIRFYIPFKTRVKLTVFNALGQRVAMPFNGLLPGGFHEYQWNGRDIFSEQLPSGIYFFRLSTPQWSSIKKLILIK